MTSPKHLLTRAQHCHDEGRFVAAADFLLEAFRQEPENHEIARELGKVLRAVGDLEGAVAYLNRAWQHAPADPITVAELILALHELNRPGEAVNVMLRSLEAGLDDTGFALGLLKG
jgi:Flp pilus assembly protein TadD